jgi:hypothetical protein
MEAFSEGKWELAYEQFNDLLSIYSKDPLYKYYSGVCLVKLNREPGEAVERLSEAIRATALIKTLPSDALFYLGRAQQLDGRFDEAVESYNMFADFVGKKSARAQGVPDFIQQCTNKKGSLSEADYKSPVPVEADSQKLMETPQTDVEAATSEKTPLDPVYEKILDRALDSQSEADSLNRIAANQKKEPKNSTYAEKLALRANANELELKADSLQKSADKSFLDAELLINPKADTKEAKTIIVPTETDPDVGSDKVSNNKVVVNSVVQSSDTVKTIISSVPRPVESYSYFEVDAKTDKGDNPVINPETPEGLIYRIQTAVFRNPVAYSHFKGITPVYGFTISGTDKTVYYAGMFRRLTDAKKALGSVKTRGFNDAFIVSFLGEKPVSADRAVILEKEWGNKPFVSLSDVSEQIPVDTIPPTLSFRVEVARSAKPLKDDIVDGIKTVSGARGMDIVTLEDGIIVYLIGNFITFVSASEYTDLLIRNGYRDARVTAWLGKKEIPVDTARQLFDVIE